MQLFSSVRDGQTCVGCGKHAPEKEANSALISAQSGWRLSRERSQDGGILIEWRCPTCWREHKRQRALAASRDGAVSRPPSSHPHTTPPPPLAAPSPAPEPFLSRRLPAPPLERSVAPAPRTTPPPAPSSGATLPAGRRAGQRKPGT